MATKKKPTKKMLDQTDLLAAVKEAGEIDLSDLMIEGFAYQQVEEAVNEGKLAWTEAGGVKLAEIKKTATKKATRKDVADKTNDALPAIPDWLIGFTTSQSEKEHIQSLWEHNPGFRKRVLNTSATDSFLGSDGKIVRWTPTRRLKTFYEAAMRFQPIGSPSACNHPEMLAYGKQGNSVGYCISCDARVRFALDGKPASVEKEPKAEKGSKKAARTVRESV